MTLEELQKQALQLPISDRRQLVQALLDSLEELQKQALQLPISDRRQLVQALLDSLQRETSVVLLKKGNLSRLRGIAKNLEMSSEDAEADYINYLVHKYQ